MARLFCGECPVVRSDACAKLKVEDRLRKVEKYFENPHRNEELTWLGFAGIADLVTWLIRQLKFKAKQVKDSLYKMQQESLISKCPRPWDGPPSSIATRPGSYVRRQWSGRDRFLSRKNSWFDADRRLHIQDPSLTMVLALEIWSVGLTQFYDEEWTVWLDSPSCGPPRSPFRETWSYHTRPKVFRGTSWSSSWSSNSTVKSVMVNINEAEYQCHFWERMA